MHVLDGKKQQASKGDLFIINIDVPHSFYPINKHELVVMNCTFMPQFILGLNIGLPIINAISILFLYKSIFFDKITYSEDIGNIFEKMFVEYQLKRSGYEDIIKILLCELLIKIYRSFENKYIFKQCDITKYKIIDGAIRFLEKNYSQKISIQQISKNVYMSRSYFSKIFKETMEMSIIEYLQKIRIEIACTYLLSDATESIISIANRVGYEDYKFFNKVFKRCKGLTTAQYRKNKLGR